MTIWQNPYDSIRTLLYSSPEEWLDAVFPIVWHPKKRLPFRQQRQPIGKLGFQAVYQDTIFYELIKNDIKDNTLNWMAWKAQCAGDFYEGVDGKIYMCIF